MWTYREMWTSRTEDGHAIVHAQLASCLWYEGMLRILSDQDVGLIMNADRLLPSDPMLYSACTDVIEYLKYSAGERLTDRINKSQEYEFSLEQFFRTLKKRMVRRANQMGALPALQTCYRTAQTHHRDM